MDVLVKGPDGSYQHVDVPAEELSQRYLSGQVYFRHPDQRVPVRSPDGTVGSIPASQAATAFKGGYVPVGDDEYRQSYLDNQYGGIGSTVESGVAGAARGLSAGLSDLAIRKGAQVFGGSAYAQEVAKKLRELQEAHPYVSKGSEALGVLGGVLATGGENVAADAAAGELGSQLAGRLAEREALGVGAEAAAAEAGASPMSKAVSLGEHAVTTPGDAAGLENLGANISRTPPGLTTDAMREQTLANLQKLRASREAAEFGDVSNEALQQLPVPPHAAAANQTLDTLEALRNGAGEIQTESPLESLSHITRPTPPSPGLPGAPGAPNVTLPGEVPLPPPGANVPSWAETVQAPQSMEEAAEHVASRIAPQPGTPSLTRSVLANTPTGLITRAGRVAEDMAHGAVEELFGKEIANSATGRVLTGAVKLGTSGAVEGGLYAMGNEISEESLGPDPQLNGEKLLSAFGHGALMGSVMGAGLGVGGGVVKEVGQSVLEKLAPKLDKLTSTQIYRAFGGSGNQKKFAKELLRAGLGDEKTALATVDRVAMKYDLLKGAPNIEALYPRVEETADEVGRKLEDMVSGVDAIAQKAELPTVESLEKRILGTGGFPRNEKIEQLHQFRELTGNLLGMNESELGEYQALKERVGTLQKELRSADAGFQKLDQRAKEMTGTVEERAAARHEANVAREVRDNINRQMMDFVRRHSELVAVRDNSYLRQIMHGIARDANLDGTIGLSVLRKQRIFLDDLIKNWARDPNGPAEAPRQILLKHIRSAVEETIVDSADKIASRAGNVFPVDYKALKQEYRVLMHLKGKAEAALSAHLSNQHLSLTGKLMGLGVFAHGGLHSIPASFATAYAHKLVRDRGTAASALILNRLRQFGAVQRSIAKVDRALDSAAEAVVDRAAGKAGRRISLRGLKVGRPVKESDSAVESRDEKLDNMKRVSEWAATPVIQAQHLNAAIGGPHTELPETAGAMATAANSATQYLLANMPRSAVSNDSISGRKSRISDMELNDFHNKFEGSTDLFKTLQKVANGQASPQHIEALKKTKPSIYNDLKMRVAKRLAAMSDEDRERMPYREQLRLATIFDMPTDWSVTPTGVKTLQEQDIQITQSDGRPTQVSKPGRMAPSRMKGDLSRDLVTAVQRLENPTLGGK